METILIIINLISNIILCLSGAGFYLAVFGRKTSIVNKWPILGHWSLRIGLASFFTGTLFNILTIYTPELTQIILNGGLALIFGWAVLFHYKYFFPSNNK
jgi:uncharacterized membrane protein YgdD (TMEM256/DUF423 family)